MLGAVGIFRSATNRRRSLLVMKVNRIDGRNDGGIFLVARVSTDAATQLVRVLESSRGSAFLESIVVVVEVAASAAPIAALAGSVAGTSVRGDESFAQRGIVAGAVQESGADGGNHGVVVLVV